eukprot:GHVP01021599.1.p1 GENE.GHVP01021599.1~~GHVP01021599.1.p1  ORF type:complete len:707 (-),score=122.24 GHVP01021599.1:4497-6617(-)
MTLASHSAKAAALSLLFWTNGIMMPEIDSGDRGVQDVRSLTHGILARSKGMQVIFRDGNLEIEDCAQNIVKIGSKMTSHDLLHSYMRFIHRVANNFDGEPTLREIGGVKSEAKELLNAHLSHAYFFQVTRQVEDHCSSVLKFMDASRQLDNKYITSLLDKLYLARKIPLSENDEDIKLLSRNLSRGRLYDSNQIFRNGSFKGDLLTGKPIIQNDKLYLHILTIDQTLEYKIPFSSMHNNHQARHLVYQCLTSFDGDDFQAKLQNFLCSQEEKNLSELEHFTDLCDGTIGVPNSWFNANPESKRYNPRNRFTKTAFKYVSLNVPNLDFPTMHPNSTEFKTSEATVGFQDILSGRVYTFSYLNGNWFRLDQETKKSISVSNNLIPENEELAGLVRCIRNNKLSIPVGEFYISPNSIEIPPSESTMKSRGSGSLFPPTNWTTNLDIRAKAENNISEIENFKVTPKLVKNSPSEDSNVPPKDEAALVIQIAEYLATSLDMASENPLPLIVTPSDDKLAELFSKYKPGLSSYDEWASEVASYLKANSMEAVFDFHECISRKHIHGIQGEDDIVGVRPHMASLLKKLESAEIPVHALSYGDEVADNRDGYTYRGKSLIDLVFRRYAPSQTGSVIAFNPMFWKSHMKKLGYNLPISKAIHAAILAQENPDLPPTKCVFFDDRLENCEALKAHGFHAVHCVNGKKHTTTELKYL